MQKIIQCCTMCYARAIFLILILIAGHCYAQTPPTYTPITRSITLHETDNPSLIVAHIVLPAEVDACVTTAPFTLYGDQGPFSATVTGSGVLQSANSTVGNYDGIISITGTGQCTITVANKKNIPPRIVVFQVVALTPPTITTLQSLSTTNCQGVAMTLHGEVTGTKSINTHYSWQVNGVDMDTDKQDFTTNTLKTDDIITFTATNYGACATMSDSKTITIPPLKSVTPVVSINASANPVCGDNKITFTATTNITDPGLTYQWLVNNRYTNINSSVFKDHPFKSGDIVRCEAGNLDACIIPASSDAVIIKRLDLPTIKFSGDVKVPSGSQVQLQPVVTGDIAAYSWSPAAGLSDASAAMPLASPQGATKYTLTVTNVNGCQAQASVIVKVTIVIPGAFTPNGDGINDSWSIPTLQYYPDCLVKVYDRYGGKVFESIGYTNYWDGTYGGKNLPSGTYYYFIQDKITGDKLSGSVTIIR